MEEHWLHLDGATQFQGDDVHRKGFEAVAGRSRKVESHQQAQERKLSIPGPSWDADEIVTYTPQAFSL